jgi:hypothetical protein
MKEKWVTIENYEGYYEISNLGNVKSLEKTITDILGRKTLYKEKLLKSRIDKKGYIEVTLTKDKFRKHFKVHRLVALHFIGNKYNKPQVNHISGVKSDNSIKNLEWVTGSENCKHAYKMGLNTNLKNKAIRSSKIVECEKSGIIFTFNSINECAREIGTKQSNVQRILKSTFKKNGEKRTLRGYTDFFILKV